MERGALLWKSKAGFSPSMRFMGPHGPPGDAKHRPERRERRLLTMRVEVGPGINDLIPRRRQRVARMRPSRGMDEPVAGCRRRLAKIPQKENARGERAF